jgi:hypothetical protein
MAQADNQPPKQDAHPDWLDWLVRERQTAS